MKKSLHFLALLFISLNLFAQAPQKMSYQAVIRNASNVLVTNAPVKMRITILQGSATGNAVYSELHSATTNANGLVTVEIGGGTSPTGTFSAINWGNGTYYLKTETDPAGGDNYSIEGTSQLLSVPYALESKSAGDGIKGVSNDTLTLNNGDKYVIPGIKKIGNPPSTINNGLVGYWPFNGNANDESGNNNNGTVDGATLTNDRFGNANKAYSFDGNDKIDFGSVSSLGQNPIFVTYSFWLLPTIFPSETEFNIAYPIISRRHLNNGYDWCTQRLNSDGKLTFFKDDYDYKDASLCKSTILSINEWYNFICIKKQDSLFLYQNGQLIDSKFDSHVLSGSPQNLILGWQGAWNFYFKGKLDDIRIYNRALTQEEITYLANDRPTTSTNTTAHSCGATDVHNPDKTYGTVTDVDGNTYKTIEIGTQTWMAENLNTTRYRNGETILNITDDFQWGDKERAAYCSYNNNSANDCPYGKLYNWYAMTDGRQICPTGWHVPIESEWEALANNLGGESIAGDKLKSSGTTYWQATTPGTNNSSGFSGLPGGSRGIGGGFGSLGQNAIWWINWTNNTNNGSFYNLVQSTSSLGRSYGSLKSGASIRCVKD